MIYINDQKEPFVTYDEAVAVVTENGIDPKRAYLFLMALGVTGAKGRVMSESGVDYLPAVKLAVRDGRVVTGIRVCKECGGFVFDGGA